ncbi:MAG: hypothetical protein IH986_16620 [Planctomycetes bacterium]|nr:hypothetical protein [Planctomycetota bacterium]
MARFSVVGVGGRGFGWDGARRGKFKDAEVFACDEIAQVDHGQKEALLTDIEGDDVTRLDRLRVEQDRVVVGVNRQQDLAAGDVAEADQHALARARNGPLLPLENRHFERVGGEPQRRGTAAQRTQQQSDQS